MAQDEVQTLEAKIDALAETVERVQHSCSIIYRRTAALAHMIDQASEGREPQMTKALRAEVDATINPEGFESMALSDPSQFVLRYGQRVYDAWQEHGLKAITPIGEMSPTKETYKQKMQ